MYNTDIPSRAALPTPKQLHRSTFLAACVAVVLLFTAYLP
ncbi:MAG: transmembrane anchor protein, partial [Proteobacteria bacterium]|nr:transmembrane anchor protein [Pseudomonadota bacterium]